MIRFKVWLASNLIRFIFSTLYDEEILQRWIDTYHTAKEHDARQKDLPDVSDDDLIYAAYIKEDL